MGQIDMQDFSVITGGHGGLLGMESEFRKVDM
jgi:hypothetical protein